MAVPSEVRFASGCDGQASSLRFCVAAPSEAAEQRSLVPLAGIEPALLAELDFESSASTSSATGALGRQLEPPSRSRRNIAAGSCGSTRAEVIMRRLDRAVIAG